MITEIKFPRELTEPLGLKQAEMRNLKPIVVLAGPNGAGKSRYLQLLHQIVKDRAEILAELMRLQEANNKSGGGIVWEVRIEKEEQKLAAHKSLVPFTQAPWTTARIPKAIELSYSLQTLANKSVFGRENDGDPLSMPPAEVSKVVDANRSGGFEHALRSVHAYFYEVARAIYEAGHSRFQEHPAIRMGLEDAKEFNRVLRALLSAEIEPELNEHRHVLAHFRGRPFTPKELSKGELVLAVWAILLHRQKGWLRGAYLLIDEPENHLHPDVCIRALTRLQQEILGPEGQIWLATHSVPLIAHAGIESVHLVDDGSITYAGNKIEVVLDRLLGGPEGRSKLRALMANADALAFDVFAAQSLLPPGVVSAREGDEQQLQMAKAAQALGAGKENVRILDFAAGRGRLAAALKSAGSQANRRFTYYAYQDPRFSDPRDQQECLEHIQSLGQPGEPARYLVDTLEGFTVRDAERMDLVVMCNVLHEIPVEDWQHGFERIHDVLARDGYLVILEDQLPAVGELPHANGYVVLNEPALQHLFGSKDAIIRVSLEKEGRLTAFAVPKAFLKKATPETIGRALASVKRMAEERIRLIRSKRRDERSFQEGRLHAHFTLLYANAQLASRQFPDPDRRADSTQTA